MTKRAPMGAGCFSISTRGSEAEEDRPRLSMLILSLSSSTTIVRRGEVVQGLERGTDGFEHDDSLSIM